AGEEDLRSLARPPEEGEVQLPKTAAYSLAVPTTRKGAAQPATPAERRCGSRSDHRGDAGGGGRGGHLSAHAEHRVGPVVQSGPANRPVQPDWGRWAGAGVLDRPRPQQAGRSI